MNDDERRRTEALLADETAAFDRGNRSGNSAPLGVHTIDWRHLRDDQAREAWEGLRGWVEWFIVRYQVSRSVVPACWYRHDALVEELSALYVAHAVSFDPKDTGLGPINWHERLTLAMSRLSKAYSGGCSNGHTPFTPRTWIDDQDEDAWAAWITQSHAH